MLLTCYMQICRQQMPHFSSDMWSAMCVLVEMLTGQKPWDKAASCNCAGGLIFMVRGLLQGGGGVIVVVTKGKWNLCNLLHSDSALPIFPEDSMKLALNYHLYITLGWGTLAHTIRMYPSGKWILKQDLGSKLGWT